MEDQIKQLIPFLSQPNPEIRLTVLNYLLSFTSEENEFRHLLLDKTAIKDLKALCKETVTLAHPALTALINLSSDPLVLEELDDEDFVKYLGKLITHPKSTVADLACMLLSNMTKHEPICVKLIQLEVDPVEGLVDSTRLLDQLVEAFHKGYEKKYNPKADFHFLANVLANVSSIQLGRAFMIEPAPADKLSPLTKIQIFTENADYTRRSGAVSVIKNCCFEVNEHGRLLDPLDINVLPFILLPLCGTEKYKMDEFKQFPKEIQLLEGDKKRETDRDVRERLLESIILLCSTMDGRNHLREKQVYRIIQLFHLQEPDKDIGEHCHTIVDFLIRDEEVPESKPQEDEVDEDMIIEEIV